MPHKWLEELARRWVPGAGPVAIQPLIPGLVNDSYRVARAGREYSLRVAVDSDGLGIDREWECRTLRQAADAGLAPQIEHCEPTEGVLVMGWVGGRTWTAEEVRQPDKIDVLAELLRRIHALPIPQPARTMTPAAWIAHYAGALAGGNTDVNTGGSRFVPLHDAAQARLALLTGLRSPPPVLCHSDLHRFNVTIGARIVLLDWEYAHVADPYWDLAGWIANNDWPEELAQDLLASYLQRSAPPEEAARLRLLVWLYDYVCLLWSELYLNRRPEAAAGGVSARAEQLELRLGGLSGSRAGQLPAH